MNYGSPTPTGNFITLQLPRTNSNPDNNVALARVQLLSAFKQASKANRGNGHVSKWNEIGLTVKVNPNPHYPNPALTPDILCEINLQLVSTPPMGKQEAQDQYTHPSFQQHSSPTPSNYRLVRKYLATLAGAHTTLLFPYKTSHGAWLRIQ
ncbi:hypothetical protein JTE90_029644 [Oedothorax gibbosus]|uniref:Uncharacterized protein n=1 Tax=Oedothorax gibbosus TaxID=931172 RepID=A0AAV6VGL0_9ARAC|nr:hypothetical protein JTE90_029644 [Oedothorax gibbosus]